MSPDDPADRRSQLLSEVLRLHLVEGWSARAIARQLGMSRNTVRHLLGRDKAARRSLSSVGAGPRESMLVAYDATIRKLLDEAPEIKAPAVVERLRPLGYKGGVTIVRGLLRRIRPRAPREPFLTLDFHPGAAMQVDWADFGFAIPGCPRRVSALVMALCYSRYLYLEFTLSQAFGTLVRAMDRGLRFFGGLTTVDIFDYVARHVIEVLCPIRFRAPPLRRLAGTPPGVLSRPHNADDQRDDLRAARDAARRLSCLSATSSARPPSTASARRGSVGTSSSTSPG